MSGTVLLFPTLIFAALPAPRLGVALLNRRESTAIVAALRENSTLEELLDNGPVHNGPVNTKRAVQEANFPKIHLAANIAYMHVPRTGGDSFFDALNASVRDLNVFPPADLVHSWTAPGCTQNEGVLGSAHCTLSEIAACLEKGSHRDDLKFVTVVREPVARTLSEFHWWTRAQAGKTSARRFWNDETAEQAQHGLTSWAVDPRNNAYNRQVKYLAMAAPNPASFQSCISTNYDAYVAYWKARYSCTEDQIEERINADRSLLEDAKRAIEERFLYVGVTDNFDQSVSELQTALGVSTPYARSESHTSPQYERPPPGIEELVRTRNALDVELYKYVVERNRKLFHQMNIALP
jgi:hypothetical protein